MQYNYNTKKILVEAKILANIGLTEKNTKITEKKSNKIKQKAKIKNKCRAWPQWYTFHMFILINAAFCEPIYV